MELRNVKTFIKIAEIGNFSRAASDLGYAQSTVTMQIQTLERELGVSLFERNGKSAVLSAAGKEFLDYAYDLQRCEAMALEHFAEGKNQAEKSALESWRRCVLPATALFSGSLRSVIQRQM